MAAGKKDPVKMKSEQTVLGKINSRERVVRAEVLGLRRELGTTTG